MRLDDGLILALSFLTLAACPGEPEERTVGAGPSDVTACVGDTRESRGADEGGGRSGDAAVDTGAADTVSDAGKDVAGGADGAHDVGSRGFEDLATVDAIDDAEWEGPPDLGPPDAPEDLPSDASTGDAPGTGPLVKVWLDVYPLQAAFPEGGIYGDEAHAFFVGSLGDGSVHRIDAATGDETVLYSPEDPGNWWTLGMDVDEEQQLLWVCAIDDQTDQTRDDPPYDGYVWVFDLLTNERIASYDLSDAFPTATCTDVAVAHYRGATRC